MEKLYAPWRMNYIENPSPEGEKCIFCYPEKEMLIEQNEHSVMILNKFPYNNGHMMVAPRRHGIMIDELDIEELKHLMYDLQRAVKAVKAAYNPDGINIGVNAGREAGAGIVDHMHIHIVPRWNGDTNFMPVIFETKVISEYLSSTRKKLAEAVKGV